MGPSRWGFIECLEKSGYRNIYPTSPVLRSKIYRDARFEISAHLPNAVFILAATTSTMTDGGAQSGGRWPPSVRNCNEPSPPNKWLSEERILRFFAAPDGTAPDVVEANRSGIPERPAAKPANELYRDRHPFDVFKDTDSRNNTRCDETGNLADEMEIDISQGIRLATPGPEATWQEMMCSYPRVATRREKNSSLIALAVGVFLTVVLL